MEELSSPCTRYYKYERGFAILRTTDVDLGDEYRFDGRVVRDTYHATTTTNRAVIVKQYVHDCNHVKKFVKESRILKGIMHKSLPRFLGSSRTTDGKLFLVLDQIEGHMNVVGMLNGALERSLAEGFTMALKVVHGLSAAIGYIEDQGLSFDLPWYSPFDLRLYATGNEWTARLVNVAFAHGCMQRPEVGTPRNTLITILKAARKHRSLPPTSACVVRLWSATIRSLLWKRTAPVQDCDLSLVPIYAQARDELASLMESAAFIPAGELTHDALDTLRHRAGLFASIFLKCPGGGSAPEVGEIVHLDPTRGQDAGALVALGKLRGVDHLIHSTDVMESCDGQWEDYERVGMPGDGVTRHSIRGPSRVNLYLGWSLTSIDLCGLSDEVVPVDTTRHDLSQLYLVCGSRTGLGEAYFYWDPVDPDIKSCPRPIHFFTPPVPTLDTEPGYWSFDSEPQDFATARTPKCKEAEWGQVPGCEYIEIIEIKAEGGRLRLNDGGWDNPQGTFDEELDKFFPLWTS